MNRLQPTWVRLGVSGGVRLVVMDYSSPVVAGIM